MRMVRQTSAPLSLSYIITMTELRSRGSIGWHPRRTSRSTTRRASASPASQAATTTSHADPAPRPPARPAPTAALTSPSSSSSSGWCVRQLLLSPWRIVALCAAFGWWRAVLRARLIAVENSADFFCAALFLVGRSERWRWRDAQRDHGGWAAVRLAAYLSVHHSEFDYIFTIFILLR
jgi:hypothetical protein